MNCCDYHADTLPCGCNHGRDCPERTRRKQEAELRWQCAASGQMSAAQMAAHARAGEFVIGYEAADPANREPVKVARDPLPITFAGREPFDWQALVLWFAVVLCFVAVVALSVADPRDLSTIWPRLVALASF